jgi:hypothetical protein
MVTGHLSLAAGFWSLASGRWFLAAGLWQLVDRWLMVHGSSLKASGKSRDNLTI